MWGSKNEPKRKKNEKEKNGRHKNSTNKTMLLELEALLNKFNMK